MEGMTIGGREAAVRLVEAFGFDARRVISFSISCSVEAPEPVVTVKVMNPTFTESDLHQFVLMPTEFELSKKRQED